MNTYRKHIIKRLTLLIVLTVIIFIVIPILYFKFSPRERKAHQNEINSLKLEIGMSKQEVIQIMGEPDERRTSYYNKEDSMYYYEPTSGASDGIYIQFDSNTDKVNMVVLNR